MFKRGTSNYVKAFAIVFVFVFSGCISGPPAQTPATTTPSSTSTEIAPVPATITPSPAATPSVPPAIKVTSYPGSANGDANITIRWEVSGGTPGEISNTAVHWGYKSGNASISDYPRASRIQTGKTPAEFNAEIRVPAGGTFFFRAHAVVDGVNVYSPEYQVMIIAPMGGGGGGGGY